MQIHYQARNFVTHNAAVVCMENAIRDACAAAAKTADEAADKLQACLESMTSGAMAAVDKTVGVAARLCAAMEEPARAAIRAQQRTMAKRVEFALEECDANVDLLRAAACFGPGPLGVDSLFHVALAASYVVGLPTVTGTWRSRGCRAFFWFRTARRTSLYFAETACAACLRTTRTPYRCLQSLSHLTCHTCRPSQRFTRRQALFRMGCRLRTASRRTALTIFAVISRLCTASSGCAASKFVCFFR